MGGRLIRILVAAALAVIASAFVYAGATAQIPASISVDPECTDQQPERLTLRISGEGFQVRENPILVFDFGEGRQNRNLDNVVVGPDGAFDATRTVTVELPPNPQVDGYVIAAFRRDQTVVTTVFRVPCPPPATTSSTTTSTTTTSTTVPDPQRFNPTVIVKPGVGPDGTVIEATGSGWPPGANVTLALGGPGAPQSVVADAAGNFVATILVLPNSGIGPRVVTGAAGDLSTTAGFLVVPATMQPPRFLSR